MKTETGMTVRALLEKYASGEITPAQTVDRAIRSLAATNRPEAWILRVPEDTLRARAADLQKRKEASGDAWLQQMPLYGVPFAVKDNVDIAGLATTAACEPFAYTPDETAFAVQRLLDAGAILIGKTNLDQFATGLVGTRSPFGAVRQVEFDAYVSGGSSSGSAVAVAAGIVAFSLGTDTAGSGRVPAGFNELVGLKPSLGLVSKRGVVPACRSLDCLSIFAHYVADAWRVLEQMAAFDSLDGYSEHVAPLGLPRGSLRVAIPDTLEFFGDDRAKTAFAASLDSITSRLGLTADTFPFAPLKQVASLLYDGPWVAERRAALGAFFDTQRAAIDPVVAEVIAKADNFSAADAFNGQYELMRLKREADRLFVSVDVLIVPTTPTHPTIADLRAEPIVRNSELGLYTNFVNLLGLCALSVPALRRADGLPAGVTLIAPAGGDQRLAVLGAQIQSLFFTSTSEDDAKEIAARPLPFDEPTVTLAVVGAHLRGEPLDWQLLEAGARFIEATTTSPEYRLFALASTTPPKPGLVRMTNGQGAAIAIELWDMPLRTFGAFVAAVPAPLGVGNVRTANGRDVKGFICEPAAVAPDSGAQDISSFGGWRAFLDSQSQTAS
ncbi:allophanate hydrolase [Burkholderia sp. YR290]|nr:allophanate hydrolase [Burkholderia sp. YR290]